MTCRKIERKGTNDFSKGQKKQWMEKWIILNKIWKKIIKEKVEEKMINPWWLLFLCVIQLANSQRIIINNNTTKNTCFY